MPSKKTFPVLALAIFSLLAFPAMSFAGDYIVVLKDGQNVDKAVKQHGVAAKMKYRHALKGYVANMSDGKAFSLSLDSNVLMVVKDATVSIAKGKLTGGGSPSVNQIPTGVRRIGGLLSPTAQIDGVPNNVNVDVAVIDTGIAPHSDLNIVGGVNCVGRNYADENGHGTHVAGTIGAKDNNAGVVGVAPGARLYAVRVLNRQGSGTTSSVICGIDWVTANANVIDVANMSLGGAGQTDNNCGLSNNDPMHTAICNSVNAGVPYAVAAGNETDNALNHTPAAYPEVITVSAYADFDGLPSISPATCRADVDETMADFSNYGSPVDIAAPGVCILSTWKGGGFNTISGTSMASPHVAGALALYKANNVLATPAQAKAALLLAATPGPLAGDPDLLDKEGLLNVSTF